MAKRRPINLALQGGGAHGAFTWGICDRLLESESIHINAITATSAGAMNAAALSYGLHLGDEQGARDKLDEFWEGLSKLSSAFSPRGTAALPFGEEIKAFAFQAATAATRTFSPYQLNPLGWNPLRDLVDNLIDFERLARCTKIKMFISATNVRTGKVRVFEQKEVTLDTVMASACLPHLYQAVEIEGEAYWDGGYMGNPSLWPLFYETGVQDLLVAHINPMDRDEVPVTSEAIESRLNEITFNAALLKEMRAIAFVQKLLREGWIKDEYRDKLADIRYHAIRADEYLKKFPLSSKYNTDLSFLKELKALGREAADQWLTEAGTKLGKKDTTDLHGEFLGR